MILKVGVTKELNAWRYFEADRISSRTEPLSRWTEPDGSMVLINGDDVREDAFLYDKNSYDTKETMMNERTTLLSFESRDGTPNNIYTQFASFIINENGGTIDRLS